MRHLLLVSLLLLAPPALAQEKLTPEQTQDYINDLLQDRLSQVAQIDRERMKIHDLEREKAIFLDAQIKHEKAVDDYWRRYTGLSK